MGDRGVVEIVQADVAIYVHWGGSTLRRDVCRAMARRWRWHDPTYLARIIFCEMWGEDQWQMETGAGIASRSYGFNESTMAIVDTDKQTITFRKGGPWEEVTFEEAAHDGETIYEY